MRSTFILLALLASCGVLTTPEEFPSFVQQRTAELDESHEIRPDTAVATCPRAEILTAPLASVDPLEEQIIDSVLRDFEAGRLDGTIVTEGRSERMSLCTETFVHLTPTAMMYDTDDDRDKDRSRRRAYLREHLGPHDEAIEALIKKNKTPHQWPWNMRLPQGITLDWCGEIDELFARRRGGWKEYYGRYPSSVGVVTLSLPGLSADRKTAVIYAGILHGPLAGIGKVLLLKREEAGWKIAANVPMWVT